MKITRTIIDFKILEFYINNFSSANYIYMNDETSKLFIVQVFDSVVGSRHFSSENDTYLGLKIVKNNDLELGEIEIK